MEYLTLDNVAITVAVIGGLVLLFGRETVKKWIEAIYKDRKS